MMRASMIYAPPTYAHEHKATCKRSCCWTPYGCGNRDCRCHQQPTVRSAS